MANIEIEQLAEVIEQELTTYSDNVIDGVKRVARSNMTKLVQKTKATAPVGKRKKHYRDSISSKKQEETPRGISYLWYVKGSNYRLSHLLNDGHQSRNGGCVQGTGFITKASEEILEEYEKEVEEVIKNGG